MLMSPICCFSQVTDAYYHSQYLRLLQRTSLGSLTLIGLLSVLQGLSKSYGLALEQVFMVQMQLACLCPLAMWILWLVFHLSEIW